jgi:hypothetical protein
MSLPPRRRSRSTLIATFAGLIVALATAWLPAAGPYTAGDTAVTRLWVSTPDGRAFGCTGFWFDPGPELGAETRPRAQDVWVSWLASAGHCTEASLVARDTDSVVFGFINWRGVLSSAAYTRVVDVAIGTAPDFRPDARWFRLGEDPVQDQRVYIHGFPGGVEMISPARILDQSRTLPGAWVALGVKGLVGSGSSGSPVMDQYGNVVGVLWGLARPGSVTEPFLDAQTSERNAVVYITPVSTLKQLLELLKP